MDPDLSVVEAQFGAIGDAANGSPNLRYPQRFIAVNRREKLYMTDGGGLDENEDSHPGYLVAFKQEDADPYSITEWDTYKVGTDGEILIGYIFSGS